MRRDGVKPPHLLVTHLPGTAAWELAGWSVEGVCTWAGWARKRTQSFVKSDSPLQQKGHTKGTIGSEAVLFVYNREIGTKLSLDPFCSHTLSTGSMASDGKG